MNKKKLKLKKLQKRKTSQAMTAHSAKIKYKTQIRTRLRDFRYFRSVACGHFLGIMAFFLSDDLTQQDKIDELENSRGP